MALPYALTSANGIFPILVRDTGRETLYLVFSKHLPDHVCFSSDGSFSEVNARPLLDGNGDPCFRTDPALAKYAKTIDKELLNGQYSYLVLTRQGCISPVMEGVIAESIVDQEAHNRGIESDLSRDDKVAFLRYLVRKRVNPATLCAEAFLTATPDVETPEDSEV